MGLLSSSHLYSKIIAIYKTIINGEAFLYERFLFSKLKPTPPEIQRKCSVSICHDVGRELILISSLLSVLLLLSYRKFKHMALNRYLREVQVVWRGRNSSWTVWRLTITTERSSKRGEKLLTQRNRVTTPKISFLHPMYACPLILLRTHHADSLSHNYSSYSGLYMFVIFLNIRPISRSK